MRPRRYALIGTAVALVLLVPEVVLACPACFGGVGEIDSPMAEGMNNGIMVLLGILVTVQGSFATFFLVLRRRARRLRERREMFKVIKGGVR